MFEEFSSSDCMDFMGIFEKQKKCANVLPHHIWYTFIWQVLPIAGGNCIASHCVITKFSFLGLSLLFSFLFTARYYLPVVSTLYLPLYCVLQLPSVTLLSCFLISWEGGCLAVVNKLNFTVFDLTKHTRGSRDNTASIVKQL